MLDEATVENVNKILNMDYQSPCKKQLNVNTLKFEHWMLVIECEHLCLTVFMVKKKGTSDCTFAHFIQHQKWIKTTKINVIVLLEHLLNSINVFFVQQPFQA